VVSFAVVCCAFSAAALRHSICFSYRLAILTAQNAASYLLLLIVFLGNAPSLVEGQEQHVLCL